MVTLTSSALNNIWNTGDTTQSITVSSDGMFYTDAVGPCNTVVSDTIMITVLPVPMAPTASNVNIPGPGTANLSATGDSIHWYDSATGGMLLGTGNSWTTPFINSSTDFWCADVNSLGDPPVMGGNAANTGSGQYHTNANNWIVFNAFEEFTINSVLVYANGVGTRTIGLVDMANNTTLVTSPFNIPDGPSRVELDFEVPGPGQYGLRVMGGNPQLWRDGIGSNPNYPFALGTYGEIIESTAGAATSYYYFFYDWEVQGPVTLCEGPRTQVTVSMPVGIEDIDGGSSFMVYPNPADQQIQFELNGPVQELTQLQLFDATGRIIDRIAVKSNITNYNTGDLASGIYRFELSNLQEVLATGQFSVQH